ncbi:hypothetical protein ISS40_11010 [Candidatus Bathyarchaeota archaeon]|nr:hypothetical protein [Candidatus Bathyarchaeota archaeon]
MDDQEISRYGAERESIFLSLFGRSPQSRILDLFLDNPLYEFTKNEILLALGMAKVTLYSKLPDIERSNVVVITRKIGKANLYRLNPESDIVDHLRYIIRSYSTALALQEADDEIPVLGDDTEKQVLVAKE